MTLKILMFLKALLPTKKIGAWLLALLGAALALFLGVSNSDLKKQYCASEEVNLPAVTAPTPAPIEKPK
jgi:hypothetical protein